MAKCNRRGFTLLELLLALGLSVLVMSIIVGLIGMYSSNFTTRGEDIRRVALARAILNMIADDLRATVTKQDYDTKVLEQMLMGQGGGSAGGSSGPSSGGPSGGGQMSGGPGGGPGGGPNNGGNNGGNGGGNNGGGNNSRGGNQGGAQNNGQNNNPTPGGGAAAAASNNQSGRGNNNQRGNSGAQGQQPQASQGAANRGSSGQMPGGTTGQSAQSGQAGAQNQSGQSGQNGQASGAEGQATDATAVQALPLGVYGSATNLTIDISRIPRLDEYNAQQNALLNGTLSDLPGDIKSVSYFVQTPSTVGVSDSMNQVTSTQTNAVGVAGLVRRALDRAVLDNAESMGQTDQLNRTGELVAPEVLALEFSYYDGAQWTTTWDSSTQGLPWLVDISLAMQSKTGEKNGTVPPGISLSTMPYEERAKYGIEIYNLTVTIPGAQLQSTSTATGAAGAATDSGMSSLGL